MDLGPKKDKYRVAGIILIVLGYLVSLNPYWWIFGTPIVFLSGVWLICLSHLKMRAKRLLIVLPIVVWLPGFFALVYFGTNHIIPSTFLIPNDFRGKITIYYGEPCGTTLKKENGRYIYKVPTDGVIIVTNPAESGIMGDEYFFVDPNGNKISKIDVIDQQDFNEDYTLDKNEHEPSRSKIAVFANGGGSGTETGKREFRYYDFYVISWDSLRVFDHTRSDSVTIAALNHCRIKR